MERATGFLEYFSNLFGKNKKEEATSGVQTVDINRKIHKVTVTGYAEPNKVLKKVKGTRKRAELWPYVPYNSVTQRFSAQSYDKKAPSGFVRKGSSNAISDSSRQDDPFTTMFSDEDPNSCTIM